MENELTEKLVIIKKSYIDMTKIVIHFCQLTQLDEIATRSYLSDFDLLLQFSLLQISALNDGFSDIEKGLIQELTDYGDLPTYVSSLLSSKITWDAFFGPSMVMANKILDMCKPHIGKKCDNFLNFFALIDAATDYDYFEDFKNHFFEAIAAYLDIIEPQYDNEFLLSNCIFVSALAEISKRKATFASYKEKPSASNKANPNSLKSRFSKKFSVNIKSDKLVNYDKKELAIAYIETDSGSGSGFMINSEGLCFTCNHVIEEASEIYVRVKDSKQRDQIYEADVVYSSQENDFALIQLKNCKNNYYFQLQKAGNLDTGHHIAVYGYPFGSALNNDVMDLEPSLTIGYIASKNKVSGKTCYYIDVNSSPGNSGGPVFSLENKKVIGYLCGSFGGDRSNIIFMRSLEEFSKKCTD